MTNYVDGLVAAKDIVEGKLKKDPDNQTLIELVAIFTSVIELEYNLYEESMLDDFE